MRAGEIVGIAGVDGNGQTRADRRDHRPAPGRTAARSTVAGKELSPTRARARCSTPGVGHIPEDRQRRGLVLEFSIAENIALHDYAEPPNAKWGWLFPKRLIERARSLIEEFDVRGGGPQTRAGGLSGGNQQKVVAAREIARDPKVLIAAQPTRGLDVGAIEYLHRRLVEERDEGRAILLISLELEEVLSLVRPHPRHLRGRDRRRAHAGRERAGDRPRDARRAQEEGRRRRMSEQTAAAAPPPDAGLVPPPTPARRRAERARWRRSCGSVSGRAGSPCPCSRRSSRS